MTYYIFLMASATVYLNNDIRNESSDYFLRPIDQLPIEEKKINNKIISKEKIIQGLCVIIYNLSNRVSWEFYQ